MPYIVTSTVSPCLEITVIHFSVSRHCLGLTNGCEEEHGVGVDNEDLGRRIYSIGAISSCVHGPKL